MNQTKFQMNQMAGKQSERTFGGRFSTEHTVANGVIPAAAMNITNDNESTGTHLYDDRS